jgi:RNA polymerase sigma-70 factor, ECF subfamily
MDDVGAEVTRAKPRDEEALIVERAKAREPTVWSRWYDDYYGLLFRYAAARLGDRGEAADIASQVFLEALHSIDRYTYRGRPILAWLYGIAGNLVSARLRQARRTQTRDALDEAGSDPTATHLESLALREAIARLTTDQREVITLTFVLGLPVKEAALVLAKKEATVYSLQARAIANLRRLLEG